MRIDEEVYLLDLLAALNRAGVAVTRTRTTSWDRGRGDSDSLGGDSSTPGSGGGRGGHKDDQEEKDGEDGSVGTSSEHCGRDITSRRDCLDW